MLVCGSLVAKEDEHENGMDWFNLAATDDILSYIKNGETPWSKTLDLVMKYSSKK